MICMGVFVIYAALASKMHRVNKVFNQSNRFQRVQVRVIDGIGPSLIFLALDLVLLITWTASSPLEFEYTDNSSACFSPDALEYSVVLALLNLGLICYALAEAWRARKVANLYSESSSMFVSMSHVLLAAIIAIPIILLTFSGDRDSESSINFDDSKFVVAIRLFAYAALVLVCCCSNLILVFAPKMRSYRTLENEKDVERAEILHIGVLWRILRKPSRYVKLHSVVEMKPPSRPQMQSQNSLITFGPRAEAWASSQQFHL